MGFKDGFQRVSKWFLFKTNNQISLKTKVIRPFALFLTLVALITLRILMYNLRVFFNSTAILERSLTSQREGSQILLWRLLSLSIGGCWLAPFNVLDASPDPTSASTNTISKVTQQHLALISMTVG